MSNDVSMSERLSFMMIDQETREDLRQLQGVIHTIMPQVMKSFYSHIRRWPQVSAFFESDTATERAAKKQVDHWQIILKGDFGNEYMESVRRIGNMHANIGLEPRWYIAAYTLIINEIQPKIFEYCDENGWENDKKIRLSQSFLRAAMLDIDFVISIYLSASEQEKQKAMKEIADNFESNVAGIVESVASAAVELEHTARSMSSIAERTSERAVTVSAAAEEATTNVTIVASSAEEMGASVSEISSQVSHAAQISSNAVTTAKATNSTIESLSKAAEKVGEVVSMISDIAAQTNLLALNATIESARAGEAGKGFAVVASEVKSLATQTAKATEDIALQIQEMQAITRQSVDAIGQIQTTIDEMSQVSLAINAAVEEQASATKEIARNTQEAATGTKAVTSHINTVQEGADETGNAATQVVNASEELGRQAEQMRAEVNNFLENIRAS